MFARTLILLYGVASYVTFAGVLLYAIGFIGGFGTPTTLDGEPTGPFAESLVIDLGLLVLFAVQHSGMARPGFKRLLTRVVPAPAERSTYVLMTNLALILLFALWRPLGGTLWNLTGAAAAALYVLYFAGWLVVLITTFLIHHFDLFGLRQVWLHFRGRPCEPLPFQTPGPYRIVRHPLYVGWLMVFWFAPTMTVSHLVFAAITTLYILVAILWEERDLVACHPEYAEYRRRVPKLLPLFTTVREDSGSNGASSRERETASSA